MTQFQQHTHSAHALPLGGFQSDDFEPLEQEVSQVEQQLPQDWIAYATCSEYEFNFHYEHSLSSFHSTPQTSPLPSPVGQVFHTQYVQGPILHEHPLEYPPLTPVPQATPRHAPQHPLVLQPPPPQRQHHKASTALHRKPKTRARSAPTIIGPPTQRGPIPASRPTLAVDPDTGEEMLSFSYSREKVVTTFTVKYPAHPLDPSSLPQQFLADNCVYPKAMLPPDEYTGKRGKYERECNNIGWTLAWNNPKLQGHRGLIQRAVDSWRNTRSDRMMWSRKVRRDEDGS